MGFSRAYYVASRMPTAGHSTRPKSRQSTTSIASNSTQPIHPHSIDHRFNVHPHMPSAVWSQHEEAIAHQMSQQPQFQASKSFAMPPAITPHNMASFRPGHAFGHVASINPQRSASFSHVDRSNTPIMDISMEDHHSQLHVDGAADTNRPRRGAATTQANDNELRRLLRENQGRTLQEIAKQINKDDSGSKQEKDKQVFGMLWYSKRCPLGDMKY